MPSSVDKRKAKYAAKYDATTIGTRVGLVKDIAVNAFDDTAPLLSGYEAQVKADILAAVTPAIPAFMIAPYLAFMRQCYAKSRKYAGNILDKELQILAHGWAGKSLKGSVLVSIAGLFGATLQDPHTVG